jgi:RNA polymerase sigma factor (sigma-70 family)
LQAAANAQSRFAQPQDDFQNTPTEPADAPVRREALAELREGLDSLDERERQVIAWRYGLDGSEELTLEQVGFRLGLCKGRVRQIECQAETKLRRGQLLTGV